jgi:sterol desaturase/sphingolipid hydroxylase (fatty acid hydroxylase superfamily)
VVETNANFGFAVSWWDRLCGTYRVQPMLGQVGMDIGLSDERTPLTLGQLLLVPLRGSAGRSISAGSRPARMQEGDAL